MTTDFLGRTPPHDAEAELRVIGAVLVRPEAMDDIAFLDPEDFYVETMSKIYGAMLDLRLAERRPTPVAVFARLKSKGVHQNTTHIVANEELSDLKLLNGIRDHVVTSAGVKTHARIVKDQAKLRRALYFGLEMANEASRGEIDNIEEWVTGKIGTLEELSQRPGEEPLDTKERMLKLIRYIEEQGTNSDGPKTGFVDIDSFLPRGMQGGRLIVMAGRPEVGKSFLAMNIAMNVAAAGIQVLRFSLETREQDETAREISKVSKVGAQLIVEPENEQRVVEAARRYYNGEFGNEYMEDRKASFADIVACSRSMKRRKGIGFIIIDHLGQVNHWNKKATAERQVSEHAIGFKRLARSLDVPILLLCHVNRQCEYRDNKRPILADLRSSGEIEGSADVILMLYREAIHYECDTQLAEVIVRKNRSGKKGTAYLWFNGEESSFASADREDARNELARIERFHAVQKKRALRLTQTRKCEDDNETF